MAYWLLVRQKTKSGDQKATSQMDIHKQKWCTPGLNPWSTPLIYTNDIVNNIESHILLFADDTSIYEPLTDSILSIAKVYRDIEWKSNWASQWLIQFNPTKTKYNVYDNVQENRKTDL